MKNEKKETKPPNVVRLPLPLPRRERAGAGDNLISDVLLAPPPPAAPAPEDRRDPRDRPGNENLGDILLARRSKRRHREPKVLEKARRTAAQAKAEVAREEGRIGRLKSDIAAAENVIEERSPVSELTHKVRKALVRVGAVERPPLLDVVQSAVVAAGQDTNEEFVDRLSLGVCSNEDRNIIMPEEAVKWATKDMTGFEFSRGNYHAIRNGTSGEHIGVPRSGQVKSAMSLSMWDNGTMGSGTGGRTSVQFAQRLHDLVRGYGVDEVLVEVGDALGLSVSRKDELGRVYEIEIAPSADREL